MKRTRSQVSPTMSPGADNEGFDVKMGGCDTNGNDQEIENVVIAGAGPAGLMLG